MGAVNTTYTFTATDTITSTKMNDIIDQTTFTNDAVFDTTLAVASGKLKVNSQGITSNELAANAVTTEKISDANVTTVKIADANVTPAKLSQPLTLGTEKATTSGSVVEFTGIPSWVKRITVILNGVSTNGASNINIQIGSGSYSVAGYDTVCSYLGVGGSSAVASSEGFLIIHGSSNSLCYGRYTLDLIGGNKYIGSGVFSLRYPGTAFYSLHGGGASPALSGSIDRIRLSTTGSSETFDAGSINIMYE